tara:strand:- start:1078 stop:1848 length:771 start_codon:yes stop_codon:yes gene_type:complete
MYFFNFFGYKLNIDRISSNISNEYIDKNLWQPFLNHKNNEILNIYNDSINKSQNGEANNFLKQLRFYSLFNIVENVVRRENYENFLECGCWKGHSSYGIAKILKKYSFNKNFYIFDSFEDGLSRKTSEDINIKRYIQNEDEIKNQINYFKSDLNKFQNLMMEFKFIKIHKGWIPDVFKKTEKKKYSFIHIDLDLYQPTYDTISFFYDQLILDGVIVCDDYNCSDFPGAKLAIDSFIKNKKIKFFYEIPLGGCIIIK